MIVDFIGNAHLYYKINKKIEDGLKFLESVTHEIKLGRYQISDGVDAIVSEYATKEISEKQFESHKKFIDIQYPLIGMEKIFWANINNMQLITPYNEKNDVCFYEKPEHLLNIDIGNKIFAVMFPEDGHCPQNFVTKPEMIKKLTIKIRID
jgi:YhcH/YjgK/YiaL family protein